VNSHSRGEEEEKTKKKGLPQASSFYCRGVHQDDGMVTLDHY